MEEKIIRRRVAVAEPLVTPEPVAEKPTTPLSPIDASEEAFLEFVKKQMETMQNALVFQYKEPTMYELNMSLSQWESVWFSLVALYSEARWQANKAKADYDEWWSVKFMEIRRRENNTSLKRTMWLSTTEIEHSIVAENLSKYKELKAQVLETEAKREMVGKIMEGWATYQYTLSRLSQNQVAEIQGNLRTHEKVDLDPELS